MDAKTLEGKTIERVEATHTDGEGFSVYGDIILRFTDGTSLILHEHGMEGEIVGWFASDPSNWLDWENCRRQ